MNLLFVCRQFPVLISVSLLVFLTMVCVSQVALLLYIVFVFLCFIGTNGEINIKMTMNDFKTNGLCF
jgi:hypothetical protein